MRVRWTSPALSDLEAIEDFVAEDDPAAAVRLARRIHERTDRLSVTPRAGRRGRVAGTRELVVGGTPYVVAYRIAADIEVLAVVHGAREWPESFG
jgi:toxin ParE1/3/4